MKTIRIITAIVITFTALSCSKERLPSDILVHKDNEGRISVSVRKKISQETFNREIKGYGWKPKATFFIREKGRLESTHPYIGYSSNIYYFGEDVLTAFFYYTCFSPEFQPCYRFDQCRFEKGSLFHTFHTEHEIIFYSLDGDNLTIIDQEASDNWIYGEYVRMTEKELEDARAKFNKTMEEREEEWIEFTNSEKQSD